MNENPYSPPSESKSINSTPSSSSNNKRRPWGKISLILMATGFFGTFVTSKYIPQGQLEHAPTALEWIAVIIGLISSLIMISGFLLLIFAVFTGSLRKNKINNVA
jgi:hypothetical protein